MSELLVNCSTNYGHLLFDPHGVRSQYKTDIDYKCGTYMCFLALYIGKFHRCWHLRSDKDNESHQSDLVKITENAVRHCENKATRVEHFVGWRSQVTRLQTSGNNIEEHTGPARKSHEPTRCSTLTSLFSCQKTVTNVEHFLTTYLQHQAQVVRKCSTFVTVFWP